uniref:corticotropin-releasing factor receptor 2-like n=1 Tax=Panthera onca TaxID=9690 RepID=UPI002954F34C|nr:corticotropin-releasing factor receptor 2-like [Panthera onca]
MDAALLYSLLEANCSLALAEELLLDGWGLPLDPEGPDSYCNTTLDQIGTCWPRSAAGALVERPCPEYFNGVKYNTTRECPPPPTPDPPPRALRPPRRRAV